MLTQILLNSLFLSSVYCLFALGLTLILGVMDIADFAQAGLFMVGAFVTFLTVKVVGLEFVAGVALAVMVVCLIGVVNNLLVYRKAIEQGANTLIAALGVLLIIQSLALMVFGPDYQTLQYPFGNYSICVLNAAIKGYKAMVILVVCVFTPMVWLFLTKTKIGKAIRAVSQEKEGAAIVGINSNIVSLVTFALGTALVGLTGALVSPVYAFDVYFGSSIIVKVLTIVIFGGLGSLRGAIVGALVIGVGENMIAAYISADYSSLVTFVILLFILFVRPQGIFGRKAV